MNRKFLLLLTTASLLSGPSFAQNPPATGRPNNGAVNSSGQNNSEKPVSGANSFTENQAKSKIEQAGYPRHVAEEGRQRRMARQGQQGRRFDGRQPGLPGQCERFQVTKSQQPTQKDPI